MDVAKIPSNKSGFGLRIIVHFCARELSEIFGSRARNSTNYLANNVFFGKGWERFVTNEKARQRRAITDITIKVWLRGQDLNL
jgi:hypothetical protein